MRLERLTSSEEMMHPMEYMGIMVGIVFIVILFFLKMVDMATNSQVATIDQRAKMVAQKVCHSESALCIAQQKAYSEMIEKAVRDPEATNEQLRAREQIAREKSFTMALEQ